MKRILFLTGTRADFGKLKPLMRAVSTAPSLDYLIAATGMHLDDRYGRTEREIIKSGFDKMVSFSNSDSPNSMDLSLARTIAGLSPIVRSYRPDLLVVHGDRVEALAGAITGSLNNVLVAHIEGGEFSGTVDELIRHSITKLSHIHFVANEAAREVVLQLGEDPNSIWTIGSPEVDIMLGAELPSLASVKSHYDIKFDEYAILAFHPVTTEIDSLRDQARELCHAVQASELNFIAVYPNNDHGSEIIVEVLLGMANDRRVRIVPSIRFEAFQTLLRNAKFIVGNSSSGVREAGVHGTPCINVGTRQFLRNTNDSIINVAPKRDEILRAFSLSQTIPRAQTLHFGDGQSAKRFLESLNSDQLWITPLQKMFHRS